MEHADGFQRMITKIISIIIVLIIIVALVITLLPRGVFG
jgi:hypothetical protein